MSQHTIPLHFTESEASSTGSTMCRLSRYGNYLASHSRIYFIVNHVPQPLIVDWTYVGQARKFFTRKWISHALVAFFLITFLKKHVGIFFIIEYSERSRILSDVSIDSAGLCN